MIPKLLKWFLVPFVLIIIAFIGNYIFAERILLRLDYPADPIGEISKHMTPVKRPVVFRSGGNSNVGTIQEHFIQQLGILTQTVPNSAVALIDIFQVAIANPNPQPLDVVRGQEINYLTYGYIGIDDRYHQITHYWGESDSTPSLLVPKVRRNETGWGDYFVEYTVYLSRDIKPHPLITNIRSGEVLKWQSPPKYPNIDRIDWRTYEGGSYNGFEEIVFSIVATPFQAITVSLGILIWRKRRAA